MKAPLYNQKGETKSDIALHKAIFEVEASEGLIHEYLMYQQTNARRPIAHVKNRSEVSGGGRKPFSQKGTGRARQGSIRVVQMRSGGSAFGPKKWQTFEKMMPKKMRKKALLGILSSKAKDGKVIALDKFELDAPKTKDVATMISKMPVVRNVLIVANREEKALRTSAKNLKLKNAKTITSGYLNPADLLKYDHILLTKTALADLEAVYAK